MGFKMQELYDTASAATLKVYKDKKAVEDAQVDVIVKDILERVPDAVIKAAQLGDNSATLYFGHYDRTMLDRLICRGELERHLSPFRVKIVGSNCVLSWS